MLNAKLCQFVSNFFLHKIYHFLLSDICTHLNKMNRVIIRGSPLLKKNLPRNGTLGTRLITNKITDTGTHTGQQWDSDDYRLVRFTHAPKQVNQNWAVNLIAEIPPKEVTQRVVWCDGGSGPEGHPRVYINLDKPGDHSCGYCGLRFIKKECH